MSGEGLNYHGACVNGVEGEEFRNPIINKQQITNDYSKRRVRKKLRNANIIGWEMRKWWPQ